MKEIELTPKAEEDLEVIWEWSYGLILGALTAVFFSLLLMDNG